MGYWVESGDFKKTFDLGDSNLNRSVRFKSEKSKVIKEISLLGYKKGNLYLSFEAKNAICYHQLKRVISQAGFPAPSFVNEKLNIIELDSCSIEEFKRFILVIENLEPNLIYIKQNIIDKIEEFFREYSPMKSSSPKIEKGLESVTAKQFDSKLSIKTINSEIDSFVEESLRIDRKISSAYYKKVSKLLRSINNPDLQKSRVQWLIQHAYRLAITTQDIRLITDFRELGINPPYDILYTLLKSFSIYDNELQALPSFLQELSNLITDQNEHHIVDSEIDKLYGTLSTIIDAHIQQSHKIKKPILILIGEEHYSLKSALYQAIILHLIKEKILINNVFTETFYTKTYLAELGDNWMVSSFAEHIINKLDLQKIPMDMVMCQDYAMSQECKNVPSIYPKVNPASSDGMMLRDKVMSKMIIEKGRGENAIAIVGSLHFLKIKEIFDKHFYVLRLETYDRAYILSSFPRWSTSRHVVLPKIASIDENSGIFLTPNILMQKVIQGYSRSSDFQHGICYNNTISKPSQNTLFKEQVEASFFTPRACISEVSLCGLLPASQAWSSAMNIPHFVSWALLGSRSPESLTIEMTSQIPSLTDPQSAQQIVPKMIENTLGVLMLSAVVCYCTKNVYEWVSHKLFAPKTQEEMVSAENANEYIQKLKRQLKKIKRKINELHEEVEPEELKWADWGLKDFKEDVASLSNLSNKGLLTQKELKEIVLDFECFKQEVNNEIGRTFVIRTGNLNNRSYKKL